MAWTSARTWTTGELVTAAIMNTHVRDNLNALASPQATMTTMTTTRTTTSTSFADLTDATATITTVGWGQLVAFASLHVHGSTAVQGSSYEFDLDAAVTGAIAAVELRDTSSTLGLQANAILMYRWTGVSAASHTVKIRWKVTAGTLTHLATAVDGILLLVEMA